MFSPLSTFFFVSTPFREMNLPVFHSTWLPSWNILQLVVQNLVDSPENKERIHKESTQLFRNYFDSPNGLYPLSLLPSCPPVLVAASELLHRVDFSPKLT
jgi:hypothetical protein